MTESKVLGLGCVVVDPLAVWQRIQMISRYARHCLVSSTDWQVQLTDQFDLLANAH
jgi:hypothetical protein